MALRSRRKFFYPVPYLIPPLLPSSRPAVRDLCRSTRSFSRYSLGRGIPVPKARILGLRLFSRVWPRDPAKKSAKHCVPDLEPRLSGELGAQRLCQGARTLCVGAQRLCYRAQRLCQGALPLSLGALPPCQGAQRLCHGAQPLDLPAQRPRQGARPQSHGDQATSSARVKSPYDRPTADIKAPWLDVSTILGAVARPSRAAGHRS